ncbi:NAD-dependent epimerase/dehydratase family protein [Shinella oryzae]|uniref:NAD(P)-dependent oxidoreductase n=1 Tax=Shinella oryzae TaxID=2871820 RepID=A0ABY9KDT2_9HYPH|nr:NAD(P)-dependent oxidoreductase [Shinella oryzae]WLS05132.1 NAD(P)-dependent oxidoreductase [Shinella oryzae]
MSRYLVTGATGFLGGAIVRRLRENGEHVIATGRDRNKLDALPLENQKCGVSLDLATVDTVALAATIGGLDCIIHCAGLSSPWGRRSEFEYSNIRATEKIIAVAKACGVRHFIHISTPAIYFRFRDQWNVAEDCTLPQPVNEYARSKALAERLILESGIPYTIVRPRGLYGRGDTSLLPRLISAAKAAPLPRFRNGRAATDITHVDDVVDAIMTIAGRREDAVGEIFNVSGGEAISIEHIVEQAARASGVVPVWRNLPLLPARLAVRTGELLARLKPTRPEPRVTSYSLGIFAFSQTLDLSRINQRLQWRPAISWEEGFARTFPGKAMDRGKG